AILYINSKVLLGQNLPVFMDLALSSGFVPGTHVLINLHVVK
ncbi:25945_t:CDS:1, partial [Gigaspora rosea]